jgi:hypothetical protein
MLMSSSQTVLCCNGGDGAYMQSEAILLPVPLPCCVQGPSLFWFCLITGRVWLGSIHLCVADGCLCHNFRNEIGSYALILPKKELIFAIIGVGLRPREKSAQPAETCAMAHVLLSQNTGVIVVKRCKQWLAISSAI